MTIVYDPIGRQSNSKEHWEGAFALDPAHNLKVKHSASSTFIIQN